MFCPKCGAAVLEEQKFCKLCGTNIQLVQSAINRSDDTLWQLGIDVEALKRNAMDFAKSIKSGLSGIGATACNKPYGTEATTKIQRDLERKTRAQERRLERQKQRQLPRPKEWMAYSWQHNLRNGLISLFSGAGLIALFYYIGRAAIDNGTITDIEEAARHQIRGLEILANLLWLLGLPSVLKGIAQIIYAAFFGESMATLAERFMPKETPPAEQRNTGPITQPSLAEPPPSLFDTPPSVTEHTTQFFEEAKPRAKQESN